MCNRRSWNWKPWGLSVLKSVLTVWTRSPLLKTGPYLEICEPDPFFDSRTEGLLHQVKWRPHRYSIIKHFLFFPTAVNGQHRWEHAVWSLEDMYMVITDPALPQELIWSLFHTWRQLVHWPRDRTGQSQASELHQQRARGPRRVIRPNGAFCVPH